MTGVESLEYAEADDDTTTSQYVGFEVGGHAFATPIGTLREIIRVPPISAVPLSPPLLEGLANLRGTVLPVLNLHCAFQLAMPADQSQARILVVLLENNPVGFRVDRVNSLFNAEKVDPRTSDKTPVDNSLLAGIVRHAAGTALLVDFSQILTREFTAVAPRAAVAAQAHKLEIEVAEADELRLVTFLADGQEYAFDIHQVEEIVLPPEKILQIPNAHASVAGIIHSHGKLLPVFHLRPMLSLPFVELTQDQRIIIVTLIINSSSVNVGLIVDSVTEVLPVLRNTLDPVPAFLGHDSRNAEITAICHLEAAGRLISVLSPEALFGNEAVHAVIQNLRASAVETGEVERVASESQLVVFRLLDEEFGLPIEVVREIIRLPEISPVPKSPDFIAGVINLRGTVVPVVNQRRRFGLPELENNSAGCRILVLDVQGVRTGFIVDSVTEVLRVSNQAFEAAPDFLRNRVQMVRQVVHLAGDRMILLFDPAQLLDSVELKALSGVGKKLKPKT